MTSPDNTSPGNRHITRTITIARSPMELYEAWRSLDVVPVFVGSVMSGVGLGPSAQWPVRSADDTVDALITEDRAGRTIAWTTADGTDAAHSGSVTFAPARQGRATEVRVTLTWANEGPLGSSLMRMTGDDPGQQLKDDLWRFKRVMETGYVPTTHGQSRGHAQEEDLQEERALPVDQSVFAEGIDGR